MSILQGFTFAGAHSSSVGLYTDISTRAVRAALRTVRYTVPGRSGTRDYGGDTFDLLEVPLRLYYRERRPADLRQRQREIGAFLARSGRLVFDDEPDKAYAGKIEAAVAAEELVQIGSMEVTFICQPWAESLNYRQLTVAAQSLPVTLTPELLGNQETPCLIRIVTSGSISGLKVIRTRPD